MLKNAQITGFADEIHSDIKIQVRLLKELGIDFLELRSANGKSIASYTKEEAKALKEYLSEQKIQVSALGSPIGKISITEEFEPHFKVYQNVVEIAKIMETPNIRMFSFYIPNQEEPEKYQDIVFDRMEHLVSYARKESVILLHENEKDIYGDTAFRCKQLFDRFYGEHFKGTFDFANFVQCGQDTSEAYELLKSYIAYIHIKDALFATGQVTPAGEGDGMVREILEKLDKMGYEGFLSLEPHLADFSGLKNLEKNPLTKNISSGEAAFTIAYEALKKILI
ncbi:xylose isomerase [Anaerocolumna cellulosilytica]|uniref:Xylose isomerase n=1 Tax=Anaerocolumna cellulosilytica TaxID=433286 RepID=A0A6S6R342_9FIRM|nr:sugar phosphate isomerase/epimerase family protein [Anaerocolumna cellulosilytica]MBB5196683.1 sugar phosphate isomerase/epimerase [Anaerocolumna cellulosilytica]BCJ93945.1 xylose isomerase [Anaerocolumna cellulosilytica]